MPPKKKPKKANTDDAKQKRLPITTTKVDKEIETLLGSLEGQGGEGFDGSMTEFAVQQIADAMHLKTEDVVLDIGSACGRACVYIACNIYC